MEHCSNCSIVCAYSYTILFITLNKSSPVTLQVKLTLQGLDSVVEGLSLDVSNLEF